jgi:dCMP deaminase
MIAQGYNGFPRNFPDNDAWYEDRETKYKYIVHAEMNLILNAVYNGITLKDSTVYLFGLPPCVECAKAVSQAGVQRLVVTHDDLPERWAESLELASQVLTTTRVEVVMLQADLLR